MAFSSYDLQLNIFVWLDYFPDHFSKVAQNDLPIHITSMDQAQYISCFI